MVWSRVLLTCVVALGHLGVLTWLSAGVAMTASVPPKVWQVRWAPSRPTAAPAVARAGQALPVVRPLRRQERTGAGAGLRVAPRPLSMAPDATGAVPMATALPKAGPPLADSPATALQGRPHDDAPAGHGPQTLSPAPTPAPAPGAGQASGGAPGSATASSDEATAVTPAYLSNPAPRYPLLSRRLGEEGTVRLRVQVSADGRVQQWELARGSGHALLDEAAMEAITRWRFTPARQGGSEVAAWVVVPVVFSLTR